MCVCVCVVSVRVCVCVCVCVWTCMLHVLNSHSLEAVSFFTVLILKEKLVPLFCNNDIHDTILNRAHPCHTVTTLNRAHPHHTATTLNRAHHATLPPHKAHLQHVHVLPLF